MSSSKLEILSHIWVSPSSLFYFFLLSFISAGLGSHSCFFAQNSAKERKVICEVKPSKGLFPVRASRTLLGLVLQEEKRIQPRLPEQKLKYSVTSGITENSSLF